MTGLPMPCGGADGDGGFRVGAVLPVLVLQGEGKVWLLFLLGFQSQHSELLFERSSRGRT
jgi:hypothetical protein